MPRHPYRRLAPGGELDPDAYDESVSEEMDHQAEDWSRRLSEIMHEVQDAGSEEDHPLRSPAELLGEIEGLVKELKKFPPSFKKRAVRKC